jgi:hypothetical protein
MPCHMSASDFRLEKAIVVLAASVLFSALSVFAQGEQVFKGTCTKVGSKYVLTAIGNKAVYQLDKKGKAKAFAGQPVIILGTLDQATSKILVDNIAPLLPPKITQAKSVFVYCDACPRGMAKAKMTALEALTDWKRFEVLSSPHAADLVFIFSANPYLGDYVTRDGPDKRPVSVDITYMNIVNPQTGQNMWQDYRQWGSLRVARATKDLIKELRLQLEEQNLGEQQSLSGESAAPKSSATGGN